MRSNPVRRLTMMSLLIAMLPLVTRCASGPVAVDPCAGWAAIRPEPGDADRASVSLVRQVLAHDEHGAALGCWGR